jgi:hypothetical protein
MTGLVARPLAREVAWETPHLERPPVTTKPQGREVQDASGALQVVLPWGIGLRCGHLQRGPYPTTNTAAAASDLRADRAFFDPSPWTLVIRPWAALRG